MHGGGMNDPIANASRAGRNRRLVARYLEATNAWDFPTLRSLLHDDVLFELPYAPDAFPRATRGIDAVMEFLGSVPAFAAEENLQDIAIDTLASDPDEVVAHFLSDMKLTSGREYRNRYILRISVRDAKIVHLAEYFDPVPLITALGGTVILPDRD